MKTLGEVLTASAGFLKERQCSRSRRIAEELVSHALKLERLELYMQFDRPVLEQELATLRLLLKRAAKGEPVEYIVGRIAFYHCDLELTPAVLIPRKETEILVDQICQQVRAAQGVEAWDLCTGSGCIGIAVKKACPGIAMTLSDLSEKALEVAARNAARNGVELAVKQGDLLSPFAGQRADLIFCNPPYVSAPEYLALDASVKDFEPREALFGGEDGLAIYRRLHQEMPAHLNRNAKVFFEIGAGQGSAVLDLFSKGPWKRTRVEKDWAGHDRFFFLEFE